MTRALDDIDGRRFLLDSGGVLNIESDNVPSLRISDLLFVAAVFISLSIGFAVDVVCALGSIFVVACGV